VFSVKAGGSGFGWTAPQKNGTGGRRATHCEKAARHTLCATFLRYVKEPHCLYELIGGLVESPKDFALDSTEKAQGRVSRFLARENANGVGACHQQHQKEKLFNCCCVLPFTSYFSLQLFGF
jgi:hypothetical protein